MSILVAAIIIALIAWLLCSFIVTSPSGRIAVAVVATILLVVLLLDAYGVTHVFPLPKTH